MGYLTPYLRKHSALFIAGVLVSLAEAVCMLRLPYAISSFIDFGAIAGSLENMRGMAWELALTLAFAAASAVARSVIAAKASQSFAASLREGLYEKIQSLPYESLGSFESGALIARMASDVGHIQAFASGATRYLAMATIILIGAVITSASINIRALLVTLPIAIAAIFFSLVSYKAAYPRYIKMQAALDRFNTLARDFLIRAKLSKAIGPTGEAGGLNGANSGLAKEAVNANRVFAALPPLITFTISLGIAAAIALGSAWQKRGGFSAGHIIAITVFLAETLQSASFIWELTGQLSRAKASNARILEIFSRNGETRIKAKDPKSALAFRGLSFSKASFAYQGSTGAPALRGVSFSLGAGGTLGVIGGAGSGKSTLAALASKLSSPTDGAVTLNNAPASIIPDERFRGAVALVPQAPYFFSGTIRENLLLASEGVSEDDLRDAAKTALALGFIEASPEGFGRRIGEGGIKLSSGERQLLAIARALSRKPQMLILDDMASALDAKTEAMVLKSLFDSGIALIILSQKASVVMKCDHILVLEAGRQAGYGTHEELMEGCEAYKGIYNSQIGANRDDQ